MGARDSGILIIIINIIFIFTIIIIINIINIFIIIIISFRPLARSLWALKFKLKFVSEATQRFEILVRDCGE